MAASTSDQTLKGEREGNEDGGGEEEAREEGKGEYEKKKKEEEDRANDESQLTVTGEEKETQLYREKNKKARDGRQQ